MINELMFNIKQDHMLYNYLKYHSYWYTRLILDESLLKEMIEEMKKEYKLTSVDKLKDLNSKLELISSFLEVLS